MHRTGRGQTIPTCARALELALANRHTL